MQEKTKEKVNELALRIVPGGKDGSGNWLIGLKEGTVFLTRPVKTDNKNILSFELLQFHIKMKWKRAVWLHRNFPHANEDIFVDSIIFSQQFELIEIQQDGYKSDLHTGPEPVADDVIDISEHKLL
jgi:hypothetical protein